MFTPYQGLLYKYKDVARKAGVPVLRQDIEKTLGDIFKQSVVYNLYVAEPEKDVPGKVAQDSILALLEHVHYLLTHKVLYIPTHFAQKLAESDMRLNFENLKLPYSIFEICFDDGYRILDDFKAPSTLVCAPNDEATFSAFTDFFLKNTKEMRKSVGLSCEGMSDADLAFVDPAFKNSFGLRYKSSVDSIAICHASIPTHEMQGMYISDVVEHISGMTMGIIPLDDKEVAVQKKLMNIAFGVICYLNTKDPDVLEHKNRNRCAFGTLPPSGLLVGSRISEESWFIRAGHPRFLRHERFHRDDEGHVRMTWVQSHSVHRGAKPLTPEPRVETLP